MSEDRRRGQGLGGRRRNVVVVLARCGRRGDGFGIRFEEKAKGRWSGTWAFKLNEAVARREGYDKARIEGSFGFVDAYPGCPWCEQRAIMRCVCGEVSCWDGRTEVLRCPWCKRQVEIDGDIEHLDAGGDR